jgi:hypothetical protein
MSDSYVVFGMVLNAPTDALDWLEQKLHGEFNEDDDEWEYPPCEIERDETVANEIVIRSNSDDYWDEAIERIVEAICEMQRKFLMEEPFSFTWSEFYPGQKVWCCHAGAVVCYKGKATWIDTMDWEVDTIVKLIEEDGAAG